VKKRTWKLRGLPEAAEAIRTSASLREAARRLGVHVSTLSRAIREGRLPAAAPRALKSQAGKKPTSPRRYASFRAWALGTYALSRPEREFVDLAQRALTLARDRRQSPTTQLQAMSAFRAIVKDLKLPAEDIPEDLTHGHPTTTAALRFPERAG
jgi:transposase-like protein